MKEKIYVSLASIDVCKICGKKKDLRAGVCFACCDLVSGEKFYEGHRLWETKNPKNEWYYFPVGN